MKTTLIFLLILSSASIFGQVRFEVTGAPRFDIAYEVEKCDSSYCDGKMKVVLNQKGQNREFQTFDLETSFRLKSGGKTDIRTTYKNQSVVRFDDFNFDGTPDLAIQNGEESGYSGPSYDIYLYSAAKKKFIANEKLSSLATAPYLGIFEIDRKRKVLRTDQKSGCCMHESEEFRYINGRLVKVYDQYEDAFSNPKWVEITTRRLVGGKWHKSVRYEKRGK